jgi:hypothetical protein
MVEASFRSLTSVASLAGGTCSETARQSHPGDRTTWS